MNKKNNKKIKYGLLVVSLIGAMIFPNFSFAKAENKLARESDQSGQSLILKAGNFCSQISKIEENQNRLIEKKAKVEENQNQRKEKLANRYQERETKKADQQAKWEKNRQEHFDKLMEMAGTDAEKQAVANFQLAMSKAVADKRVALDLAVANFRAGVEQLWQTKKATVNQFTVQLQAAVQTAIAKAKDGCASANPDEVALQKTFREEMKLAKDAFQVGRGDIEKTKDQIQALNEIKKQAIDKAMADFKVALEKAKADFQIATGKTEGRN